MKKVLAAICHIDWLAIVIWTLLVGSSLGLWVLDVALWRHSPFCR